MIIYFCFHIVNDNIHIDSSIDNIMKIFMSSQVSFIDSWLLCRKPIKHLLLWAMRTSDGDESKDKDTLWKQTVYSFGDHYYFRKELKILNLLTGYRVVPCLSSHG